MKNIIQPLLERCSFPEGPVNCAVSGGADSMALLALASSAGLEVTAIHVDNHEERFAKMIEENLVKVKLDDINREIDSKLKHEQR